MVSPHRLWKTESSMEGAAATELALLLLVLVPIFFYSLFFYELVLAKMKAQEAARYLVWEIAAMGLSDWKGGRHAERFTSLRGQIAKEVAERWGDDQQSATPTVLAAAPEAAALTLAVSVPSNQAELFDQDAGLWDAQLADGISTGPLGRSVDALFSSMGFDRKGKIVGAVTFHIKSKLLGPTMLLGFKERKLPFDTLDLKVEQTLIANQWNLQDGRGAVESAQEGCKSDYCFQLDRMHMAGLGRSELGRVLSAGSGIVGRLVSFHDPLKAVIASKALSGAGATSAHELRVADPPGHHSVRLHYTNVYRDTTENDGISTYQAVYRRLGNHYLGCPRPQEHEGDCRY